jgi:hypothetical protein
MQYRFRCWLCTAFRKQIARNVTVVQIREMKQSQSGARANLPYFELKFPVTVNELKIGTVRGDEPGSVSSSRERDEYVEMQVAELI